MKCPDGKECSSPTKCYAKQRCVRVELHEGCEKRGGVCDCSQAGEPCYIDEKEGNK